SSEAALLVLVGNWCRAKEKAASGRRLLEDSDWAVAAYEDASGAKWPRLAYEEVPQVRPMTGKSRQRSWRHICLLVRDSIELGSFFGAGQSHAPSQDATNSVLRQPNFAELRDMALRLRNKARSATAGG
ncbi:MAG: hypothetical protein QOI86_4913, partial [Actinomycetota bacterium]|nr:hypothetical protein [Actinomycetota bacterium]